MKSLLFLALGAVCGAVVAVLVFSVDPDFDPSEADGAGGGNSTLVLTEEALGVLFESELHTLPRYGEDPQVAVIVGSNGIMVINISVGSIGAGVRSSLTVNPEIVEGRLKLEVVQSKLELATPEELAAALERPIQRRLEALADGAEYRVTAIRTTDHRLAVEVEI